MAKRVQPDLTKRERQIMDLLYRAKRATATELQNALGLGSNSTVRTQLRVLEQKGHVRHVEMGLQFIYMPTIPPHRARVSALTHVVMTFFAGSYANALIALLESKDAELSHEERSKIAALL